MKRTRPIAVAAVVLAGASMFGQATPSFQVDPLWPRPLPNHWLLGSVGVAVDKAGNVYGAEVGPRALKKYVRKQGRGTRGTGIIPSARGSFAAPAASSVLGSPGC